MTPVPFVVLALVFQRITRTTAIAGLALVLAGETIRFWGVSHVGIASRTRVPTPKKFVVGGPYRYVRHPLYLGNFLIAVGFTLAANALFPWLLIASVVLFAFQYGVFIWLEEEELSKKFGDSHRAYLAEVPAFLPTGRRAPSEGEAGSFRRGIKSEWRSLLTHAGALGLLWAAWRLRR